MLSRDVVTSSKFGSSALHVSSSFLRVQLTIDHMKNAGRCLQLIILRIVGRRRSWSLSKRRTRVLGRTTSRDVQSRADRVMTNKAGERTLPKSPPHSPHSLPPYATPPQAGRLKMSSNEILFNSPALHSLKRAQLVKICKRHGLKASGKVGSS